MAEGSRVAGWPRVVVFDLDGTLVDSAPDLRVAANRLLEEAGAAPLDLAEVISFVGNGIPVFIGRCLAARGLDVGIDALAAAIGRFKMIYGEAPAALTVAYPGVETTLAGLAARGCRLGVCTNKAEGLARAVLEGVGLASAFDAVIGGDTLATRKPDPEGLLAVIATLGSGPEDALYVGDSEVDAETAVAAGVAFALFSEGYRKSPVKAIPHRLAVEDMGELVAVIEAMAGGSAVGV